MKKALVLLIIGIMAISFAACSTSSSGTNSQKSTASEQKSSTEKVIYDNNNVKVTYLGIEEGAISKKVKVRVENNSDSDLEVHADDASINDYMIYPLAAINVNKGKKAIGEIEFSLNELKEKQIDDISKVEFKLRFLDPSSLAEKFSSDLIVINP